MHERGAFAIHYTVLPAGQPPWEDWDTYRREVGRLLAEGHEGKFVLIKDGKILGFYESFDDARDAGLKQFLLEPCLIHQVRTWEPLIRTNPRCWPCHSSRSR